MWQEITVGICVLLAAAAVLRRMLKGSPSCGSSCSGCSSQGACSSEAPRTEEHPLTFSSPAPYKNAQ